MSSEDTAVNWVEKRVNCTLDTVFDELLKQVKMDIETAKKMLDNRRGDLNVVEDKGDDDTFVVWRGGRRLAVFGKEYPDKIAIVRTGKNNLKVVYSWNIDAVHCDLKIEGKGDPQELWQISQRALVDLLFDEG